MKNFLLSKKQSITVAASGLVSILMVAGIVYSATTISTNVNTGGTLTVSGASTQTGAVTMSSTLNVTGLTTLGYASTTGESLTGNLMVGGRATTTGSTGNIATEGTLTVNGLSTLTGYISTASSTVIGTFNAQGNIGAGGTSTPAAELSASGSATTTLYLHSTGSKIGGCIELLSATGTVYKLYIAGNEATTTGVLGSSRTTGALVAIWEPGSCK